MEQVLENNFSRACFYILEVFSKIPLFFLENFNKGILSELPKNYNYSSSVFANVFRKLRRLAILFLGGAKVARIYLFSS